MNVHVCYNCKSKNMEQGEVEIELPNVGNVKVPAIICNHCGESIINEREVVLLENVVKAAKDHAVGA